MPDDTVDTIRADNDGEETEDVETTPSGKTPRRPGPLDDKIAAHAERLWQRQGLSLQDVADRVRPADPDEAWNKSRVAAFKRPARRVTITELADLCKALGVDLGVFLQDAKVVALPRSTRGWIEADSQLEPEDRAAVLRFYDAILSEKN